MACHICIGLRIWCGERWGGSYKWHLQEILVWLKENNYVLLKNIDLPKSLLADGLENGPES